MDELHWIRRFYRAYLARYWWARQLKRVYLALRLCKVWVSGLIVWHVQARLNTWRGLLERTIQATRRPATRAMEKLSLAIVMRTIPSLARFYSMRRLSERLNAQRVPCRELAPATAVDLAMPSVLPEAFAGYLRQGTWPLRMKAVKAYEIKNAKVMGKSELIFLGDKCLHHDYYRFERDQMFEEMHELVFVNAHHKLLSLNKAVKAETLPAGISLLGGATSNYIHWLTETLPKLALIDGVEAYRDFPYLVDSGLHPNIMDSVHQLNSTGRKVILVERCALLTVKRLVAISPVAYSPFDFRPHIKAEKLDITPDSALYSGPSLVHLRDTLVSKIVGEVGPQRRRLFLRRTGQSRPMANAEEVEALMVALGFEIVEPERLGFADQVRLFSNAGYIVGQGGAALGNMIFAPPGCRLVVLTTWSPYTIHYYFANLANILGHHCTLLMCDPVAGESGPHRAHMGVNVPIHTLEEAIQI